MRVKVEVVIDAPGNETERILRWMVISAVDEALRELTGVEGLRVEYPGIWTTCEGQRSISAQFVSGEVAENDC
jgi:hypothetical protein